MDFTVDLLLEAFLLVPLRLPQPADQRLNAFPAPNRLGRVARPHLISDRLSQQLDELKKRDQAVQKQQATLKKQLRLG